MKLSIFFSSFFSMYGAGSKSGTSPAMRTGKFVMSKRVICLMPERPSSAPFQDFSTPVPRGLTIPTPVTATLLISPFSLSQIKSAEEAGRTPCPPADSFFAKQLHGRETLLLAGLLLYVLGRVLYGLYLLGVLVRYLYAELLLESHDHLDGIERVGAEIINERSSGGDLVLGHIKLLYYYLLNLIINRHFNYLP